MGEPYLFTEHMAVGYGKTILIDDVSIRVAQGEIVTLIGPNGAGKSTILKSMIRQLALMGGRVVLDGDDMAALDGRAVAKKMSVLMTERMQPELMTCFDVVAAGRYPYTGRFGVLSSEDRLKVRESLALVHALELEAADFSRISDGQRQRVLLARAIRQEPEVIVLDEPTSFLDIRHKLELLTILKEMVRERGVAVIVSLHELDLAQRISDTVVCVCDNHIDRVGEPEDIFTDDYIRHLYGVKRGGYHADFGCPELEAATGEPQTFVIGGGGSGISCYRRLQRKGVPFFAGVLHTNDIDYAVAKYLAAQVIDTPPFEPIGGAVYERARACMHLCKTVYCTLDDFGSMNEANRRLMEEAHKMGILREPCSAGRVCEGEGIG